MKITQEPGTDKSAPFVELMIDDFDGYGGSYEITIRKYPKRIIVAYSHDSGLYQGDDNMDVFLAPAYITEKTLHAEFDLLKALVRVCSKPTMYGDNGERIAKDIFDQCAPAWNYIMQGNIQAANKSLPEEEYDR
jgi:hypothetical protein